MKKIFVILLIILPIGMTIAQSKMTANMDIGENTIRIESEPLDLVANAAVMTDNLYILDNGKWKKFPVKNTQGSSFVDNASCPYDFHGIEKVNDTTIKIVGSFCGTAPHGEIFILKNNKWIQQVK